MATDDRPVSSFTNCEQGVFALHRQAFQLGQGNLRLIVPRPAKSQDVLGRLDRRVVKQTLVDTPDLEDRQGTEAELAGSGWAPTREFDLEHLEGVQQVQDGAVIDRDRWLDVSFQLVLAVRPSRNGN